MLSSSQHSPRLNPLQDTRRLQEDDCRTRLRNSILRSRSRISLDSWQGTRLCSLQVGTKASTVFLRIPLTYLTRRTYGVLSISKLMIKTQQLSKAEHAGRRFPNTDVLIVEMLAHSPSSERVCSAIARTNYITVYIGRRARSVMMICCTHYHFSSWRLSDG
jgi:hypothetical protein